MKTNNFSGISLWQNIKRNKKYAILLGCIVLFYAYSVFTGWAWFNFVESEKNTDQNHSRSYHHK